MKAVRIHAYGGPEVLQFEDAPRPVPGKGEVLVRVHAASINPLDWKARAGYLKDYIPHRLPFIPGWDLSGVVESNGAGASLFQPGDAVYGMADPSKDGAYAEYIAVPEAILARKPASIDHAQAAAVPLAGLTAWHGLFETANLQPGQRILITGGAGGVGSFAVQIAKWKGARVSATASARNHALLRELGAEEVVDYTTTPFEKVIKNMDLVLDTVGGETFAKAFATVRKGGTAMSTAAQPDPAQAEKLGIRILAVKNRPDAAALKELAGLIDAGRLRPIVESRLPLAEARKAHEMNQTGHTRGKIVLLAA
jgi:NADPH:quinone reductase-like Zn-dependent oxidoreductase